LHDVDLVVVLEEKADRVEEGVLVVGKIISRADIASCIVRIKIIDTASGGLGSSV
jgi:hypothetical protein